jgi:hypothetical protein
VELSVLLGHSMIDDGSSSSSSSSWLTAGRRTSGARAGSLAIDRHQQAAEAKPFREFQKQRSSSYYFEIEQLDGIKALADSLANSRHGL